MKFLKKEKTVFFLFIIVIATLLSAILSYAAITQSEFDNKLKTLKEKYPDESTWNGTFDGGSQCWGFARLIAYNVYGEHVSNWSQSKSISGVKAGDLLQYGNTSGSGHTVFVTSVSGNTITFVDCNGNGNYSNGVKVRTNGIKWGNTISKNEKMFNKYTFSYRIVSPALDTKLSAPKIKSHSNVTPTSATVSWDKVTGAEKYELQYREAGTSWNDSTTKKVTLTGTSYTASNLNKGRLYWFRISAIKGKEKSDISTGYGVYAPAWLPSGYTVQSVETVGIAYYRITFTKGSNNSDVDEIEFTCYHTPDVGFFVDNEEPVNKTVSINGYEGLLTVWEDGKVLLTWRTEDNAYQIYTESASKEDIMKTAKSIESIS